MNYHKNMRSISVHSNHNKKKIYVFFLSYKKEKMPSLSTKKRKAKLCVAIKEFNDELLNLVTIQDKYEKIYPINEQQVAEIDELYDEIWKFDEPIKNLEISLAKNSVERSFAEQEIDLIKATKEKISRLKAELECKQDLIMQEESEIFKIFSGLYHDRRIALDDLHFKGTKLEKLGVPKIKIEAIKESNNLGQST